MNKTIRFIHIKELTKTTIFNIYHQLHSCKFYEIGTGNELCYDNNFWNTVKGICTDPNMQMSMSNIEKVEDYDDFILVNISNKTTDSTQESLDYFSIQYLLSFLFQLDHKYTVCFYQSENAHRSSNYYRVSNYLNLWLSQSNNMNNFFYLNLSDNIHTKNPKRLAYSFKYDTPSEKILPIICLEKSMYQCLQKPYMYQRTQKSLNKLLSIVKTNQNEKINCQYYEEYIYQAISKMLLESTLTNDAWKQVEVKFLNSFPPLIVVYVYAIIKSHLDSQHMATLTVQSIIEKSYDYTQGLMQLIENSIKHVLDKSSLSCAFFSIRMHHKVGCMDQYINHDDFKKLKYYLEISVLDCTKDITNVGILNKYNEALKKSNLNSISNLSEIFEYPFINSEVLDNYYSNAANVANHYGLQIFDTILTANNGLFIVQSGLEHNPDIYINSKKVLYNGQQIYFEKISENLKNEHFSGTNYTIILPITNDNTKSITTNLSLGNSPLRINKKYTTTVTKKLIPIQLSGGTKEDAIQKYIDEVHAQFQTDSNGIIALSVNELSRSRIHLELLCKAIISIITSTDKPERFIICLVDIYDEYRLLDAVRIISLFYDKTGHCNLIKNKGIYLECNQNSYDVLFTGNSIKSVLENIERQRLIKKLPETFYKHIFYALKDRLAKEN